MRTVRKALKILDMFSESSTEFGLSELSRAMGYDKATTQRMLVALADHGMVEQHPETKKYRLGAELLRLARVRESAFPISEIVDPALKKLADETGETAHFSLASGNALGTLGIADSKRANRINIEKGERLPFHCTGSGIAYLAFSPPSVVDEILSQPLPKFSNRTETNPEIIRNLINKSKKTGIGMIDQGYEAEVVGFAAPIFDGSGFACGAVAVALPNSRSNKAASRKIKAATRKAAIEISRGLGGKPHPILSDPGHKE